MRGVALAGSLALIPLVSACGGGEDGAPANGKPVKVSNAPAAGVVAPAKIEVIAGLAGCKAEIRVEADELREGLCHTEKADYVITTFPHEKFKQSWLDAASMYGGTYLVGTRWVVSAKPEMLGQLRARLGGTVQQLRGSGPTPAPSGS
ncbi:hypothetical protein F7R91_15125 [Streptomyces luteolifulvus]|jgi:hypothetical protein|uniref:Lipoprotein n=1 Tax=Streptomyces luteolifulvus TaxID=2615112 RepID=A0A6H9V073_9ACTN|nr:hypothetical protein [Streptomyces luteolifulvus]KAB1146921.1 hypothetical protein F7R91_15125 [Streptomyces luteolifulvus]